MLPQVSKTNRLHEHAVFIADLEKIIGLIGAQSFTDLIENSGISNHRRACSGMGNRVTVRMLDVVRLNAGLQTRHYIPVPMAAKGAMAFNIVALIA